MNKIYIREAFRFFSKNVAFAYLNFFGLLFGFIASLILVSYVNFQLSFDSFHPEADKIFRVQIGEGDTAPKTFPALSTALKDKCADCLLTRLKSVSGSIGSENSPFQEQKIYWVDDSFLSLLEYPLLSGKRDEVLKRKNTAVISEKLAAMLFGQNDPVGRTFIFSDLYNRETRFEITGVLANVSFNSHLTFDALFSYSTLEESSPDYQYGWSWRGVYTYIKLPDVRQTIKINSYYSEIVNKYKDQPNNSIQANEKINLVPIQNVHLYSHSSADSETYGNIEVVYFLSGFAILIFIISVFNYLNLTVVSATFRNKEIGIKKILGASKIEIIRQFFIESILIYGLAFIFSVCILIIVFPYINEIVHIQNPIVLLKNLTVIGMIFTTLLSGVFVSCLYTFILSSKTQPLNIISNTYNKTIKSPARILVVVQLIVTIFLLVSAYTIYLQINYMRSRDLGINTNRIMVIKPPRNIEGLQSSHSQFKNSLLNLNAISSFTACSQVPGKKITGSWWDVEPEDKRFTPDANAEYFLLQTDGQFVSVFELKLIYGRNFKKEDVQKIIINEKSVKLLGFQSPIDAVDQNLKVGSETYNIIGIVKDYHHLSLREDILPLIISNKEITSPYYALKVNADEQLVSVISDIEKIWKASYTNNAFDYFFLNEAFDKQYQDDVRFGKTIGIIAFLIMIISYFGLVGTLVFATQKRSKEISIRRLLGCDTKSIFVLFFKSNAVQIIVAAIISLPISFYLLQAWITRYPFRIELTVQLFLYPVLFVFIISIISVNMVVTRIVHSQSIIEKLKD